VLPVIQYAADALKGEHMGELSITGTRPFE